MQKTRIAMLCWESRHSIAVGGLAEHVTELSTALVRCGHDVHLFTRMGPGQARRTRIDGVHYHRCPYETHADFMIDNARMCDSLIWHLAEAEADEGPYDIIHGHDWLVVRSLEQAKNRHQRHVVMTFHSTEFGRCGNQLFEGQSRQIRDLEWAGTYLANGVICVSRALRDEVQHLYSTPGDKMTVVYNGVDVRRFDTNDDWRSTRRRFGLDPGDPVVLFAGRMTAQKGPDLLLEAVPGLIDRHPRTRFVFAGDGDLTPDLRRRTGELGVTEATRFVGHRNGRELVGLFKAADLVCVPSRNEPFGIVILEAWSARKPVVATLNGGPAEFVEHDTNGVTVSDDYEAIGAGVSTLLADKAKGRRMGRNGRRQAESRFSWDVVAAATERVYQTVIG